ncbi:hypothetical protein [Actinokineospora sp. NPDC004072]
MRRKINRYPLWQAHRRGFLSLVLVGVLGAAAGAYFLTGSRPVHVTDGAHVFSPDLAPIQELILAENQRVENGDQPWVSIVFADPMAPGPGDLITADAVRHDLQGAYLAQRAWNAPENKRSPQVRLLLADLGSQMGHWSQTAAEVRARVDGDDRVVAVVGLGVSTEPVRRFVDEVAKSRVAIVAGAITGDEMTEALDGSGPVPGMVRVAPTNSDMAVATLRYLDRAPNLPARPRVLEVRDQNRDDNYAITLGEAFSTAIRAAPKGRYDLVRPQMVFNSALAEAGTILSANANKVCEQRADVVHFAGRGSDLRGFLRGLASRACAASRHLLVLGPPDIARSAGIKLWESGAEANMTVLVPGLTNPRMWQRDRGAASGETVARFGSCPSCYGALFPTESLSDSDAALSHDAVWTAILAIRAVVAGQAEAGTHAPQPAAAAVAQALNQLRVDGVSGWICSFDGDHNPVNKAVPILHLDHAGGIQYQALSSPEGTPVMDGCSA